MILLGGVCFVFDHVVVGLDFFVHIRLDKFQIVNGTVDDA